MISKTDGEAVTEQTFDLLNRMTGYDDGETQATYTYYADNMRKSKTVNGVTTRQVWVGDQIALDITGENVVKYVHGLSLIVSDYGWYHYDAHGNVVQLTDNSGTVTENYDYDPYGVELTVAISANPYRFCGEYTDYESGYVYLRARYYDPSIGRFISQDPALDGHNWYSYCAGNPIMFVDPSGQWYTPEEPGLFSKIASLWWNGVNTIINNPKESMSMLANEITLENWTSGCHLMTKDASDGPMIAAGTSAYAIYSNSAGASAATATTSNPYTVVALTTFTLVFTAVVWAGAALYDPAATKAEAKTQTKAETVVSDSSDPSLPTYYHVTSAENAASIMATKTIYAGSEGSVYAWRIMPSKETVQLSGSRYTDNYVMLAFESPSTFVRHFDPINPKCNTYMPVQSMMRTVTVMNPRIVVIE